LNYYSFFILFGVINLQNARGSYVFNSVQLAINVSEEYGKSVETLTMHLFSKFLLNQFNFSIKIYGLVKSSIDHKQIFNDQNETCDPKYLFEDESSNLQLSAFLLVKVFVFGELETVDLRPVRFLIG
jgi:hypothetical protein